MKFSDVEQVLGVARSDKQKIALLEKALPKLRGSELRSALIVLANLYVLQRKFSRAAQFFELVGMHEEAVKARARL